MKRSKIKSLPDDQRAAFERELIRRGFADYAGLALWVKEHTGIDIGKSAAHRYGSQLERRIEALKNSTEAAKLIAESFPDDADQQSAAVMRLVQHEIFEVVLAMQKLDENTNPMARAKLLAQLAQVVAPMSRASVAQKKHAIEIRDKVSAAAERATKIAKKGGMTAAGVDNIRREILGIAG